MPNRDIVVIGASAGGVEALKRLVRALPGDFPAAVFIVLHLRSSSRSLLAQILDKEGVLPAVQASDGDRFEPGRIYVARPDCHMLLGRERIVLHRGPRENMSRPAIDPLFRSAAAAFESRVIGVVLTGTLNDGTAGLYAVKRCGGIAVVQDPADAEHPEMPRSALRDVAADHVVPLADLGPLLVRLVREPAGPGPWVPEAIRLEAGIQMDGKAGMGVDDALGKPSHFTCPDCNGALWEIQDGKPQRYRCHVGHSFTARALMAGQSKAVETALWSALRALQERADLLRRMATEAHEQGRVRSTRMYEERASEYEQDAGLIRQVLFHGASTHPEDMAEAGD